MKVTKRRKISNEMLALGFKGQLLEIVARDLDYPNASKLKKRLDNGKTNRERKEITYLIEENEG